MAQQLEVTKEPYKVRERGGRGDYIIHNEIKYIKQKPRNLRGSPKKSYWRCSECERKTLSTTLEPPYVYLGSHGKHHPKMPHQKWNSMKCKREDVINDCVVMMRTASLEPKQSYHQVTRNKPDAAELIQSYVKDVKQKLYYQQKKCGISLPKDCESIGATLRESGYDGNHYRLKLMNISQEEPPSTETLEEWKRYEDIMYLGTDNCELYQCFGHKTGAQLLATQIYILYDLSFSIAPKICAPAKERGGPSPILYEGVLWIVSVELSADGTQTPFATPAGCFWTRNSKLSEDEYLDIVYFFRRKCIDVWGIDILGTDPERLIYGMADMEDGLRNAFKRMWINLVNKVCWFHINQALGNKLSKLGLDTIRKQNGTSFSFPAWQYFRCYMDFWLLPRHCMIDAFNMLAHPDYWTPVIPPQFHNNTDQFIKYFRTYYMRPRFVKESCQYRMKLRNNDVLEGLNNVNKQKFGNHPYLFAWIRTLGELFADCEIKHRQYRRHGVVNDKRKSEKLKEKCLDSLWDFIDSRGTKPSYDDLQRFLRCAARIMKAKKDKELVEILQHLTAIAKK